MKSILTTDKANKPFGFVQLDGNSNIPSTVSVQGTASYAAAAGTAVSATSASVAQTAISASYAPGSTQWLNDVSGGVAYRAGDVTIGGTTSYPGLAVKVYKPTVGGANSEGEMDAVIADSPLFDNFITPSVNATSYSTYTGTNQEYYAMEIEGYITVPSDTTYWFGLDSDDASDAFINNIKVSDLYGANSGYGSPFGSNRYPIALTAGKHAIKVRFQEFGGGDFVTLYWSLNNSTYFPVPSSWFTYETTSSAQLIAANGIDFTNNSLIQSVPSSSGDGLNASTLELKPDTSLGTDQYIVLDPTSNGHIHIRPGGAIDQSSADLILGGENTNVKIGYNGTVAITGSSLSLNGVIGDLRPYKVYTALLTQTGGDNVQSLVFDDSFPYPTIVIGTTYEITQVGPNIDFTLIGAPDNNIGTKFVATGTYADPGYATAPSILQYNTGAPVVTVLENTIGNIWFTYSSNGIYEMFSDSLFTVNKTIGFAGGQGFASATGDPVFTMAQSNINNIELYTSSGNDGLLNGAPIEIRVYP